MNKSHSFNLHCHLLPFKVLRTEKWVIDLIHSSLLMHKHAIYYYHHYSSSMFFCFSQRYSSPVNEKSVVI